MNLKKVILLINLVILQHTSSINELSFFCDTFIYKIKKKKLYCDIVFETYNYNDNIFNNSEINFQCKQYFYDQKYNQNKLIKYKKTNYEELANILPKTNVIISNKDEQILPLKASICFFSDKYFNIKNIKKRKYHDDDNYNSIDMKISKQNISCPLDINTEHGFEKILNYKEILSFIKVIVNNYENETNTKPLSYEATLNLPSEKLRTTCKYEKIKHNITIEDKTKEISDTTDLLQKQKTLLFNKKIKLAEFNKSFENCDFINDLLECVDPNQNFSIDELVNTYCNIDIEENTKETILIKPIQKIEILSDIKLKLNYNFDQKNLSSKKKIRTENKTDESTNGIMNVKLECIPSNKLNNNFLYGISSNISQNAKFFFCNENHCNDFAIILHKKFKKNLRSDKLLLKELSSENSDYVFDTMLKRTYNILLSYVYNFLNQYIFNETKSIILIENLKTNHNIDEQSLQISYYNLKSIISLMLKERFYFRFKFDSLKKNEMIEWINNFGNKTLAKFTFSLMDFDKFRLHKLVKSFKNSISKKYSFFTLDDIINFLMFKIRTINPKFDRICIFQVLLNILQISDENYKLTQLINLVLYIKIWYNMLDIGLKIAIKDDKFYVNRMIYLIKCSFTNDLNPNRSNIKTFTTIINDILMSSLYKKNLENLNHKGLVEHSFLLNFLLKYDIKMMNAYDAAILHVRYNEKKSLQFAYSCYLHLTLKLMIDNELLN